MSGHPRDHCAFGGWGRRPGYHPPSVQACSLGTDKELNPSAHEAYLHGQDHQRQAAARQKKAHSVNEWQHLGARSISACRNRVRRAPFRRPESIHPPHGQLAPSPRPLIRPGASLAVIPSLSRNVDLLQADIRISAFGDRGAGVLNHEAVKAGAQMLP
jgi:hypothetical protein